MKNMKGIVGIKKKRRGCPKSLPSRHSAFISESQQIGYHANSDPETSSG